MPDLQLDLTTLRLFVAVCETHNFLHAGLRQHLVASAVSKRMTALEQQVHAPLFVRKRHGVTPTAAGLTFLEYARAILAEAHKAQLAMAAYDCGARGHVRVLATASVVAESLADDIVRFMRQSGHTGIKVDVEERFSPDVVRGVREGHASLGITWDAVNLQGLHSIPYRCDQLGIVVPQQHALWGCQRIAFEDTLQWEQVSLPATSAVQILLEHSAMQAQCIFQSRGMVSNFEAGLRMARAGLALCVVPKEIFETTLGNDTLHWVQLSNPWALRQFVLCYQPPATSLALAAQLLITHLRDCSSSPAQHECT